MIGCVTQQAIDAQAAAAALKTAGPPGTEHHDQQGSLTPVSLRQLHQQGSGSRIPTPLDESIAADVTVQQLDFAGASGGRNLDQMGPRRPSGDPGQRAEAHTAPTGYGATFRQNAPQQHTAALYLTGPKRGAI